MAEISSPSLTVEVEMGRRASVSEEIVEFVKCVGEEIVFFLSLAGIFRRPR